MTLVSHQMEEWNNVDFYNIISLTDALSIGTVSIGAASTTLASRCFLEKVIHMLHW